MSATLPRKALISISCYHGVIYPDGTKTGLFYTEALHPFEVLTQAGFEVDLASETGTYGLDDLSLTDRFLAGDDKAVYENATTVQRDADIAVEEGCGSRAGPIRVVLRFRGSRRALRLSECTRPAGPAENVWQRGGIVAAVCHGPVLLPGVIDAATGTSIIDGKTVTGFTVEGEVVLKVLDKLASDGVALVVDAVTKAGADYSSPMQPFDDYSITGGRLVHRGQSRERSQRSRKGPQGIRCAAVANRICLDWPPLTRSSTVPRNGPRNQRELVKMIGQARAQPEEQA